MDTICPRRIRPVRAGEEARKRRPAGVERRAERTSRAADSVLMAVRLDD